MPKRKNWVHSRSAFHQLEVAAQESNLFQREFHAATRSGPEKRLSVVRRVQANAIHGGTFAIQEILDGTESFDGSISAASLRG